MAAIGIPNNEPWIVGQKAFRALMDQLSVELDDPEDRHLAETARGLGGLDLGFLPSDQAYRVATAMAQAAKEIRLRIESEPMPVDWDREFADLLASLEARLHEMTEGRPPPPTHSP